MRHPVRTASLVLLAVGVVYGGLLLLEVLLWSAWSAPPGADRRSLWQVVDELRGQGDDALAYLSPFTDAELGQGFQAPDGTMLPILTGPAFAVTVTCNESGAWGGYTADRHGFNNPDGAWDTVRRPLVVLGGDAATGYCGMPGTDVGAGLRGTYRSVVNLGQGGAPAIGQLAILKEFALALRPCLVVWLVAEGEPLVLPDDVPPVLLGYLQPRFRLDVMRNAEDKDAQYRLVHEMRYAADEPTATTDNLTLDASLFRLPRARLYLSGPGRALVAPRVVPGPGSAEAEFFAEVLQEGVDALRSLSAETLVVYLPAFAGAVTGVPTAEHAVAWNAAVDAGADWLDLTPQFATDRDVRDLFAASRPNHYSEAGYQRVAGAIADYLGTATSCALR